MSKDLPKMYAVNFNKEIKNNEEVFESKFEKDIDRSPKKEIIRNNPKNDRFTIEQKIFNIFNAKDYIYKADVTILTDNEVLKKRIVGKNNNNLITIDNEYIPIDKIRDIYKS